MQDDSEMIGTFVDARHRIDAVLGKGGFATVYLGTDTISSRQVAVKVLDAKLQSSAMNRARFQREIVAVARLRSPNTVRLFSHGETPDGRRFIVFEHVPGRDLAEVLKERATLDHGVTKHVLAQVLHSVNEAHSEGVIHRDLKPENIRVFRQGDDPWCVKVLDFGVARLTDPNDARLTATGQLLGTPRYMSPEQLLSGELTPASDIYSAGLVALEMLLGSDTLQGHGWGAQLDRLQSGYLFPVAGAADAELMPVIQRMTARAAEERYQSAAQVLSALNPSTRATAPPPSPPQTTPLLTPDTEQFEMKSGSVFALVLITAFTALLIARAMMSDAPRPSAAPVIPAELNRTATASPASPAAIPAAVDVGDERDAPEFDASVAEDGCGVVPKFVGTSRMSTGHSAWHVHLPKGYDSEKRHPVILLFHDDASGPAEILQYTDFSRTADEHGYVVVAPHDPSLAYVWGQQTDAERARIAVEGTAQAFCIDRSRVHAIGHGAGSVGVLKASCHSWVRSAVVSSFSMEAESFGCSRTRPTPTLLLFPTQNGFQPPQGGGDCIGKEKQSFAAAEELWRKRNACTSKSREYYRFEKSVCERWECADALFVACRVDGGRPWPGTTRKRMLDPLRCDGPPPDFPQNELIMKFIKDVEKSADPVATYDSE